MLPWGPVGEQKESRPVVFANRIDLVRNTDHVIVRFGFRQKEKPDEDEQQFGEEVTRVVLPLTANADLALKAMEVLFTSAFAIQDFFNTFAQRMHGLNAMKAQIEAMQAQVQAQAKAQAGKK